jgi:hypothetical protein
VNTLASVTPAPPVPLNPFTGRPFPPDIASLPIYYEDSKGFRLDDGSGRYVSLSETAVRRYLIDRGFNKRANPLEPQSEVDNALHQIQLTKVVDYVGPLAGRKPGMYEVGGKTILVTGAPKIIQPDATVQWPFLKRIFEELLATDDPSQLTHFYCWLHVAYTALRAGIDTPHGPDAPGQALAIAGAAASGKTLLQHIIKEILGGRSANPYPFMSGRTGFNADLLGAEVLMFGDEQTSTHMNARRASGDKLKGLVAESEYRCEGKFANALILRPFWRVTMSLNDEPENVCVLPPLDESIADKLMLLRARPVTLFNTSAWSTDRTTNMNAIRAELPGFLAFIDKFQIPDELRDHRFGVKAYHHIDLVRALGSLSSEQRLLELIDSSSLFSTEAEGKPLKVAPVVGRSAAIERRLINDCSVGRQAARLLVWDNAMGTYLARLAKSDPHRVSSRMLDGYLIFTINSPHAATTAGQSK